MIPVPFIFDASGMKSFSMFSVGEARAHVRDVGIGLYLLDDGIVAVEQGVVVGRDEVELEREALNPPPPNPPPPPAALMEICTDGWSRNSARIS